jgi:hypothetical protein
MRIILSLLFCFALLFCRGQQNERKFSVTATSAILHRDFVFQPGFQYIFDKWAVIGEVTYLSAKRLDFHKGYWLRSQAELKRYLTSDEVKFYLSFQTAYGERKFVKNDSGTFYTTKYADSVAAYHSAVIHSPVLSFAPKLGFELSLSKSMFLDLFGGMGARIIFTRYDAEGVKVVRSSYSFREWFTDPNESWLFDRTLTKFHLTAGIRVGVYL